MGASNATADVRGDRIVNATSNAIAAQPNPSSTVRDFITKKPRLLINGEWVDSRSGKTHCRLRSGDRARNRAGRRRRQRGRESAVAAARAAFENGPWADMTPAAREALLWKLSDLIEKQCRRARRAREPRTTARRKFMASIVDVPGARNYFRYMAGWATKIEGSTIDVSIGGIPGAKFQHLHAARAGRRRRADHPVELPARDGGVEARAGARGRLHLRPEARRADAAHGAAARRADHRGGIPAGRRQHSDRARRDDRRRARRPSGRRQDRVHGLDRGRQDHQQERRPIR